MNSLIHETITQLLNRLLIHSFIHLFIINRQLLHHMALLRQRLLIDGRVLLRQALPVLLVEGWGKPFSHPLNQLRLRLVLRLRVRVSVRVSVTVR